MSHLRTRTLWATLLATLLLTGAAVLAAPAPAWAHTELLSTSPADAAVLTSPFDEVTLTFSGPVRADGSTVTVTGPDGRSVSDGAVSVLDFVVHQPVSELSSGAYRVDWVVVAGDGHPLSGQFTFQLSLPAELEPTQSPSTSTPVSTSEAAPTPTPSPSPTSGGGPGGWLWWLLVPLMLGLAAVLGLRRARRG